MFQARRSQLRAQPYSMEHRQHPRQVRSQPVYNPYLVQHEEVRDMKEETKYRDSLCQLCSDIGCSVYHHHVSSQAIREFAKVNLTSQKFNCIMCKAEETTTHPPTRKVILTSSTLFNVWSYHQLELQDHLEVESIVGGRFRDLTRALLMLYLKHPERLEIVVVAGLNNIGDGQAVPDIIDEITELKEAVQAHTQLNGHSIPSVVSFSTVLYAPKFCSLDVPEGYPEWTPPPNFKNYRENIEGLNAAIAAINKSAKVNYLNLHLEGIRIDPKAGKKMHKLRPEKPIWREREVRRRLHLTPDYKVKTVRRVANMFRGGLTSLGDWKRRSEQV